MSEPDVGKKGVPGGQGPNLTLIYGLMLLAFLVAFGLAALVVLPYYQHRH